MSNGSKDPVLLSAKTRTSFLGDDDTEQHVSFAFNSKGELRRQCVDFASAEQIALLIEFPKAWIQQRRANIFQVSDSCRIHTSTCKQYFALSFLEEQLAWVVDQKKQVVLMLDWQNYSLEECKCVLRYHQDDSNLFPCEWEMLRSRIDEDASGEEQANMLTILGILSGVIGQHEEAQHCYSNALKIIASRHPDGSEKQASLLFLLGAMHFVQGQDEAAMDRFEESLTVPGKYPLAAAKPLCFVAFLHKKEGRLEKALECLERALEIYYEVESRQSKKLANVHAEIGAVAREMGDSGKAQAALKIALQMRKCIYGPSHEAVGRVLQELGDLMDGIGNYKAAMDRFLKALEIYHTCYGRSHCAVADTYYSMGYTLQNQGSLAEAFGCFEEALAIRKTEVGPDSKEVGDVYNMMGCIQTKRGELDSALPYLWDALRIRKMHGVHGDHIKLSETIKNVGDVHSEKGEPKLALGCYQECLRIRRSLLGTSHETVADALVAIGNAEVDLDRNSAALLRYQEALEIRKARFGKSDDSVASVLQKIGTVEFQNGAYERALQSLIKYVEIREVNRTERDGDHVNVLFMIGNIHKMEGNHELAVIWWTRAYDMFEELGLAAGNPFVAVVMDNLLGRQRKHRRRYYFGKFLKAALKCAKHGLLCPLVATWTLLTFTGRSMKGRKRKVSPAPAY